MLNPSKISVIIPAYNAEKTIESCVNAALHQEGLDIDFEIIVIDDGSKDTTADIVRSFDRVKYIYQENSGPAVARNTGAKHATGDILCFTDSDCMPQSDWLATIMRYMDISKADIVAGSYGISNSENLLAQCIHQEILYRHQKLMREWVDVFGSYNVAFRREIFEKVRGFDESYRTASGEDNDLSYRLKKAGYRIRFAKDAYVDHCHPERVCQYLQEQFRHGYWRARLYKAHPQMMKGDGYTFLKDIAELPLTTGLMIFIALSFFGLSWLLCAALALLFFIFECWFSVEYGLRSLRIILFFGSVMLVRALTRTLGFSWGSLKG